LNNLLLPYCGRFIPRMHLGPAEVSGDYHNRRHGQVEESLFAAFTLRAFLGVIERGEDGRLGRG
jgi:hypothetical protein